MNCVTIEQKGKYTYIKCKKCGNVLITNDPELSLAPIKNKQLISISSCEHFQVIENEDTVEIISKQS